LNQKNITKFQIERNVCYKCYHPSSSCMCSHISAIETNTHFVILMHPKEFRHTKNGTGNFTNLSLKNCELHVGIDFSNYNVNFKQKQISRMKVPALAMMMGSGNENILEKSDAQSCDKKLI